MIASLILPLLLQSADALPECDQVAADKGIQQAMNQCAYRDYLIADAEMNVQWRRARAKMKQDDADFAETTMPAFGKGEGYSDSLLEAQRGWLRFRKAQCRLEGYTARGGTMEPLLASSCMSRLTRLRTQELRELADTLY